MLSVSLMMGVVVQQLHECTGCHEHLPTTDFHDVLKWRRCKVCIRSKMKTKYHTYTSTREDTKVRNRTTLLIRYGLTWTTFRAMLVAQDHKCAICYSAIVEEVGAPRLQQACVDHCHATGKVRGLLCMNCNLALGYLKDSPAVTRRAASYLEGI